MRRDWKAISSVLDVIEQLAGHPNLKELRDEANEDLKDLLAKPMKQASGVIEVHEYEPEPEPDPMTEAEANVKLSRRSL